MTDQSPGPEYPKYPGEGAPASMPPPPPRAPAPAVEPPSSITTAVKLMWAGAALAAVSLVVSLLTLGSLKDTVADALRDNDPNVSQSTIDASYSVAIVSGIVGGIIAIGLWAWMAWKNGEGRSWARIVATVLGAINVLSLLSAFISPGQTAPTVILGVVSVVLGLVILVLLWQKSSTAYYRAVSERPLT